MLFGWLQVPFGDGRRDGGLAQAEVRGGDQDQAEEGAGEQVDGGGRAGQGVEKAAWELAGDQGFLVHGYCAV